MAQWARSPQQPEEKIFHDYATKRLKLSRKDAARFRELALLSEKATLRGMRSAAFPNDVLLCG